MPAWRYTSLQRRSCQGISALPGLCGPPGRLTQALDGRLALQVSLVLIHTPRQVVKLGDKRLREVVTIFGLALEVGAEEGCGKVM